MKMGDIIRQLRLQRGITQEELGKIIGVQKSAVRKYEKGAVENIKRTSIKKMADFFGVSPTYLMGLEENTNIGTNNGIIGNNNHDNHFGSTKALTPIQNAIVAVCSALPEDQQSEVLSYATKLLNKKESV